MGVTQQYFVANMTRHEGRGMYWRSEKERQAAVMEDGQELIIVDCRRHWQEWLRDGPFYKDQSSRMPEECITDFLLMMLARNVFQDLSYPALEKNGFDGIIFEPDNVMLDALIREFERYDGESLGFKWVYDLYIPVLSIDDRVTTCRPLWRRKK